MERVLALNINICRDYIGFFVWAIRLDLACIKSYHTCLNLKFNFNWYYFVMRVDHGSEATERLRKTPLSVVPVLLPHWRDSNSVTIVALPLHLLPPVHLAVQSNWTILYMLYMLDSWDQWHRSCRPSLPIAAVVGTPLRLEHHLPTCVVRNVFRCNSRTSKSDVMTAATVGNCSFRITRFLSCVKAVKR